MKTPLIVLFIFLFSLTGLAQHSISGNFTPSTDFKWLILYQLTPGSQRYVTDTAIKEGYFKLELPENASVGMYRIVYAVPQDEFYIDVIYNGKEDIEFNFNLEEGIHVIASEENKTYYNYFSEINTVDKELSDFYAAKNNDKKEFSEIAKKISEVQARYEVKAGDLLVHQFVSSNLPYIPETYENFDTYNTIRKKRYFDALDVTNALLQSSGFLEQKLSNYVFSALPSNGQNNEPIQDTILVNVDVVSKKLSDTPVPFRTEVFHDLWKTASENNLYAVSDTIFDAYLKDLATQNGDQALVDAIELSSRLRIGAVSPEISWEENGTTKTLLGLQGAEKYVLVFWSSTCSHCLKELPLLHTALKTYDNVTVVAVGLEDDDTYWNKEIMNLPNFKHAIALGKWESDHAKLFGIQQTPTYFILDTEKRFLAAPEDDKEVVEFLDKN
ncbi:TlpA family protein disulfide reductase [Maribacter chungangensis]|uniref:TlpA family protein disulfide reductase n=1 Tax=Maribacter chungangensis TaxID=1069117 RepID=A0ABW3B0B2_9FLAO